MGKRPEIHLIVARAQNGVIGDGEKMPWSLRDDLAYFKQATMGSPIVMGRRTWATLGRPLPGRRNLVLSRDSSLHLEGAEVFASREAVLEALQDAEKIFVIGGGEIYRLFADDADVLHITDVKVSPEGLVTFPALDQDAHRTWVHEEVKRCSQDARNDHDFVIRVFRRVSAQD